MGEVLTWKMAKTQGTDFRNWGNIPKSVITKNMLGLPWWSSG